MADFRQCYHDYEPRSDDVDDVLKELDDLLDGAYDAATETSLKKRFLTACFEAIDTDQRWQDLVRTAPRYHESWGAQKKRATALRQLMTQQIGWPVHKGLLEFDRQYLVGILLAVKASCEGVSRTEVHAPVTLPPDVNLELLSRELPDRTRPESHLPTLLSFSDTIRTDAKGYLNRTGINTENHNVVYVIDCTPDSDNEQSAIPFVRRYAQALKDSGNWLSDSEAAAMMLSESGGLLYVGYSQNFPKRMEQHHRGVASGGANFLNLYKPERLLEVTEYGSKSRAKEEEPIRANELQRQTNWFVYQY